MFVHVIRNLLNVDSFFFQVKLLCTYMEKKGQGAKVQPIKKAKIERLNIGWTNKENKVDCGVYSMRHMECYMGSPDWETGLKLDDNKNLNRLRELYMFALINSDSNEVRDTIMSNINKKE